jgi:Fe-S-cluster containining protein
MSTEPVYDCQACGACCIHEWNGSGAYVLLEPDEAARLKRMSLSVVEVAGEMYLGTRAYRGGQRCCVAFRGEVGGFCGCSIYDARPNICRQFEAGEALCREARARLGLPV